jgi:hypothetical protein
MLCGKRSWTEGRKSGETVPMMRYGRFRSESGDETEESEASEGLLTRYGDDETGVTKRAPCGCPAKHG